ncbi:MAG: hypothetical protein N2C14_32715, partial [Planctomycetales bacterium]
MRSCFGSRLVLRGALAVMALVVAQPLPISAAAPEVTYLFPAGSQRGQSQSVALGGKFSWPLQVWVDRPGLKVDIESKEGVVTVAVAKDASPGLYWLRFHNEDGASSLRPFEVGVAGDVL